MGWFSDFYVVLMKLKVSLNKCRVIRECLYEYVMLSIMIYIEASLYCKLLSYVNIIGV